MWAPFCELLIAFHAWKYPIKGARCLSVFPSLEMGKWYLTSHPGITKTLPDHFGLACPREQWISIFTMEGFEAFYPRLSKIQCSIFKSSPFLCLQYVSLHSHTFWVPSIFTNQRWDYHLTSWKSPGYDVCMLEFARVVVRMRHGEGEGGSVDSLIASSPELIPRKLLFFSIKRIDAARRSTWKLMRQARPTRESLRLSSAWRWATGWKDERQKSWSLSWMSLGENVCWLYWWPSGRQTTKVELKERSLHPGPRTPPA